MDRLRCLALLLFLPLAPCGAQESAVRVVGNHAPPYRILGAGPPSGIYIDAFNEVARLAGFQVTYQEASVARGLALLESGNADVMLGPNRTADREAYLVYTKAELPREEKVFYSSPGRNGIAAYADLARKVVAVVRGAVYFEPFDSDLSLKKEVAPDYESAFRKVGAGRNDVVIAPELQGDWLVRSLGMALVKGTYRVEGRPSYIVLSRRSPALPLQARIEAAWEEVRTNGTWDRIVARYR